MRSGACSRARRLMNEWTLFLQWKRLRCFLLCLLTSLTEMLEPRKVSLWICPVRRLKRNLMLEKILWSGRKWMWALCWGEVLICPSGHSGVLLVHLRRRR